MTQHIRGGLDGVCVQPTVKRGLCPSCLGDRVGEVRKFRACRQARCHAGQSLGAERPSPQDLDVKVC